MSTSAKANFPNLLQFPDFSFSSLKDRFGLRISVLSGPHSGAKTLFGLGDSKSIIIGRSIDSDIVLLGAEIASRHLTIIPGSLFQNTVYVSSNGGSVRLKNKQVIQSGQRVELSLPAELSFGDSSVLIDRNFDIGQVKKLAIYAALFILSIFAGLVGSNFIYDRNSRPIIGSTSYQIEEISVASLGAQQSADNEVLNLQNETVSLLQDQIASVELDKYLSVGKSASGVVEVTGILPQEMNAKWRSVLQWYDGRTGMASMINNVSIRKPENLELTIRSVWLNGDLDVVIMGNGQVATKGDIVEGGWVIQEITDQYILVQKNSQIAKLTY